MAQKKQQYHYGRISKVTNAKTGSVSYITGPVQEASGAKFRGARGASIDHVIRLVKKSKSPDVTLAVQGQMYTGSTDFKWVGEVFDKKSLLSRLDYHRLQGSSMEEVAEDIFGLKNGTPQYIGAWNMKEHISK